MKRFKTILAVLLALSLAFALCACGEQPTATVPSLAPIPSSEPIPTPAPTPDSTPEPDPAVGEYRALCAKFSPAYLAAAIGYEGELPEPDTQYVDYPSMAGYSVTLDSDGTGYLNWGEDNQGPIDSWSLEGTSLLLKAGVSEIRGSLENSVMTLILDDGMELCFALPGADTSGIETITLDQYLALFPEPGAEYPAEGEYRLFALEREGYLVDSTDLEMASILNLSEGGTGFMTYDEDRAEITSWVLNGEDLTITLDDGGSAGATLRNGVLILDVVGNGESLLYYAQEGVDLSSFPVLSLEEFLAAIASEQPAG